MTALRVSLHVWLDAPDETPLRDLVQRSLAEAGRGFAGIGSKTRRREGGFPAPRWWRMDADRPVSP